MTFTEEEFTDWRSSRVTDAVFALITKHAEKVKIQGMDAAWNGIFTEEYLTSCRAEYRMLTQIVGMDYADFVGIEQGNDNDE